MFVAAKCAQSSFPPTQNGLFKQSRSDKEDLMCSRSNGSAPTCLVLHRFTALSQADNYFRGQWRVCERGNFKKGKIYMPLNDADREYTGNKSDKPKKHEDVIHGSSESFPSDYQGQI